MTDNLTLLKEVHMGNPDSENELIDIVAEKIENFI